MRASFLWYPAACSSLLVLSFAVYPLVRSLENRLVKNDNNLLGDRLDIQKEKIVCQEKSIIRYASYLLILLSGNRARRRTLLITKRVENTTRSTF